MIRKALEPSFWQCVVDADALINIERKYGIETLEKLKGSLLITDHVEFDVARHPKIPRSDPLRKFVERNPNIVTHFKEDEGQEYLQIRARHPHLGAGEVSSMVVALKRNLTLVTDEKETKATGKAKNIGIKTITSEDFIKGKNL